MIRTNTIWVTGDSRVCAPALKLRRSYRSSEARPRYPLPKQIAADRLKCWCGAAQEFGWVIHAQCIDCHLSGSLDLSNHMG